MTTKVTAVYPVNELGELVAGNGTTNIVGYLAESCVPIDDVTGKVPIVGLGSFSVGGNTAILFGDSITAQNFVNYNITSISCSGGVATMVLSGSPSLYAGAAVYVAGTAVNPDGSIGVGGIPEGLRGLQYITGGSGSTWTFSAPTVADIGSISGAAFPRLYNLSQFQDNGYFVWGQTLTDQPFDLVGFSASTGRYTAEALQRISEVTQYRSNVAFVLLGTNDSNQTEANLPINQVLSNLKAIWKKFLDNGTKVVAITLPPQGGATPSTATVNDRVLKINQFIRDNCSSTTGMYLLDWYKVLVNPVSSPVGQPLTGVINSTDGLHPTTKGAYLGGKLFSSLITNLLPAVDRRVMSNFDNMTASTTSKNMLDSAPWTTSGGTVTAPATGVAPTGWAVSRSGSATVAFSAPSRSDGIGYDIKADITSTANGDGMRVDTVSSVNSSLLSRLPNTPFSLNMLTPVKVVGQAIGNQYSLNSYYIVTIGVNTANITAMASAGYTSASENVPEDWSGTLRTPPLTFSTKPTAISAITRNFCSASGSAFSVQFGRMSINLN